MKAALGQRISASPLRENVELYEGKASEVVNTICDEIATKDRIRDGKWSTFNIAFVDPEGIEELPWETIARLASINKMDLIINFCTRGLLGCIGKREFAAVDRFFGIKEWRNTVSLNASAAHKRRALIDFYLSRLSAFGYYYDIDPDLGGDDIAIKNAKNAQQYSIIFASKNELGEKFWKITAKRTRPPRLPGFE